MINMGRRNLVSNKPSRFSSGHSGYLMVDELRRRGVAMDKVSVMDIGVLRVGYVVDGVNPRIIYVDPPISYLSLSKLYRAYEYVSRRDFIKGAVIHGVDGVVSKLSRMIVDEIRRRVGRKLVKLSEELMSVSVFYNEVYVVRKMVDEWINEYASIPRKYRRFFSDLVNIMIEDIRRNIEHARKTAIRSLDEHIMRMNNEFSEHISDFQLSLFLNTMNSGVWQDVYRKLEIADILEEFVKYVTLLRRGEITIRIRVDPEMVRRIMNGDLSELMERVRREIERKIDKRIRKYRK